MMKTDTAPKTKFLKDYKAPDFKIENVHLDFNLREGTTTVTATTKITRQNKDAKDLILDGQSLTLKSVVINGEEIGDNHYTVTDDHLTLHDVPDAFTLKIVNDIHPEKNTALEGLYRSGGNYCTQCESEGFRKITYYLDRPDVMTTFTTRIEADKKTAPVLLGNGNCLESGDVGDDRHFAIWEDPFVKPSYLFALVAGDLAHIHDTFTTCSGKKVDLYIYVDHGNEDKCDHAMKALKDSMKWDEEKYGREYDLNIFNIVAVNDFNFGAMENKSLNIFNSKLILAKPETATDMDYSHIEAVVAHEYFHNWTGNRITCRDWFQLSLKEGLTVFRDHTFSGDMNSHAVERIHQVEGLRNVQFAEDASPMAHPIRPDSYIEIGNFYTATVYEKGAEVIRMYHTLLGAETYRKGMDIYFDRHDGQAVTCDDFFQSMQDATDIDLSQFKLWYHQAGTPIVIATTDYDEKAKTFNLTLEQKIPNTPGQTNKKPMHIPIAFGLLNAKGEDILDNGTEILNLTKTQQTFTFKDIHEKPTPSILRGFSAPIKLQSDLTDEDLIFLMAHDTDGFNRWDSGQTYLQRLILSFVNGAEKKIPQICFDAFHSMLNENSADQALLAKALTLPADTYLAQLMDVVDVDGIHDAREFIKREMGQTYLDDFKRLYDETTITGAYSPDPISVGKRALKSVALRYIQSADSDLAVQLAAKQYGTATNMTDKVAAMAVLIDTNTPERDQAFDSFYNTWKTDPLVLDKWFSLQALADRADCVESVSNLTQHADFTYKNPNRLRSLMSSFSFFNPKWFHRADGAGYKLLADAIIKVNAINPSTAARLVTPLRQWKRYDTSRKALMENELRRILSEKDISNDVYEIVSKSLEQ